ncbi:tRNA-dependent cyclodipeptide synthase [Salmonella enterica]|nr:tRNA-dependent cyclodipeptide synthase [Salmonella enterica]EJB3895932.1 tRNA-dependent cyclodipeptide synthase [Salmonella enterica]HBJ5625401.1 tRNA-dependent cyclodipeptide synthase [Salmonella enterica subsp. enterica serovar Hvittingfoss]
MKEQQVLFGISPFNSRFSEVYLEKMLNWGFDNYDKVDILHPHEEARYLLMGCGDNENKAKKKSRKEFYRAERIIHDYISKTGCTLSSGKILRFSDFYGNIAYQYFLEKVRKDYSDNSDFYTLCTEQSEKAIIKRKISTENKNIINKKDIEIATEYILRELPFLIAPSVLLATDCNVHISYYCTWPVADYLYQDNLSLSPHSYTKIVIKDHVA